MSSESATLVIGLRDLQYRSRRFLVAVGVAALVFGVAVAIDGIKRNLQNEPGLVVGSFNADTWVVRAGNSSPFTTTAVLPESVAGELAATPGVRTARPVVIGRLTVEGSGRQNANLIGYVPAVGAGPKIVAGRAPRRVGEVAVGGGLDVEVGNDVQTTAGRFRVVGLVQGERYNAGAPTLFMTVAGAQQAVLGGRPLVMGVAVTGHPTALPAGTTATTNSVAAADLALTIKNATRTIDFVALLSWVIAAGVIGAITYLSAIERTRDFAVLRATGATSSVIVGGLLVQSLLLAVIASLLSVPLALVLRYGMPLPVKLSAGSVVQILLVGIVVGVLASAAAIRRAVRVDPALAFGER